MIWFLKKISKKIFLHENVRLTKLYNMVWFIFRCGHYLKFYLLYLIFLKNLVKYLVNLPFEVASRSAQLEVA